MNKQKLVLVGGGGHCKACIDIIQAEDKFEIVGIVDKKEMLSKPILGYAVVACDNDLPELVKGFENFFITIGQIKNSNLRKEKFKYLKSLGAKFPVIISPTAYASNSACIEEGSIIMHKAVINTQAKIGKNCIVNTRAIIEHDATIGDHSHISTGAIVNGECVIGESVFVGSNSVISNCVSIGNNVVIGAGSTVIKNIIEPGTYAGNPAREIK